MNRNYSIDLTPFYEPDGLKPLLQSAIIQHNFEEFDVDRWFGELGHCYVFICTTNRSKKAFAKKPSYVEKLIKEKKLTIIKSITI